MHRLLFTSSAVLATFVALATASRPAHAGPNVEIGGTAGIHVFSDDNELGVPDVDERRSERNSALFGLRLGVFFNDMIGIEGEFGVIPSEVAHAWCSTSGTSPTARTSIAQFGAADPTSKLDPVRRCSAAARCTVVSTEQRPT